MLSIVASLGILYFKTNAAIPHSFNFFAISRPSCLIALMWYPPPGKIISAVRVAAGIFGMNIVRVGTEIALMISVPLSLTSRFSRLGEDLLFGISFGYKGTVS